jgi:hypothetical protein
VAESASEEIPEAPDPEHTRPAGVSDVTVLGVGKVSEALEWVERARGRLFDFHQMIGHADFLLDVAVAALEEAGNTEQAQLVRDEIIGRNVLDGRWTFQVVEEFIDTYYQPFADVEERLRDDLLEGRRHVFESELKEERRTRNLPGHTCRPARKPR